MNGRFLRIWLLWLAWLPATALGDGGFIPATAFERVQIPDQRALIHFTNGTETLVIDTAFKGEGTNFAWIIPVPSAPAVEPATTGLFTTLQILFQPEIVHDVFPLYRLVILAGLFIALGLWNARRGRSVVEVLLLMAFLSCFLGMLLPALSTAGAGPTVSGVNVIARKRVGIYETATLQSPDGAAVFDWLNQNGYATPTNFIPAIQAYSKEGWYFVASKIRLDASLPDGAKAHPLALKFKTDRPVYPLRLTGINNESCRIELYVFGPGRAELPHFEAERCAAPSYPPPGAYSNRRLEGLRIRHPLLRTLVKDSPAATRLVGQLSSRQMESDAYITWTPLKEKQLTFYSSHGAAVTAANIAVPILMVGLLALLISNWHRQKKPGPGAQACKVSGAIILLSVVCWGAIYLCLPKVEVVVSRMPALQMDHLHSRYIPAELMQRSIGMGTWENGKTGPDIGWVRQQLAETSEFRRGLGDRSQTNLITGEPWREEDSPGNYTLRETTAGIDYVWYDLEGRENSVPLFQLAPSAKGR